MNQRQPATVELYEVLGDNGETIGYEFIVYSFQTWQYSLDLREQNPIPWPHRFRAAFRGYDSKGQTDIGSFDRRRLWPPVE